MWRHSHHPDAVRTPRVYEKYYFASMMISKSWLMAMWIIISLKAVVVLVHSTESLLLLLLWIYSLKTARRPPERYYRKCFHLAVHPFLLSRAVCIYSEIVKWPFLHCGTFSCMRNPYKLMQNYVAHFHFASICEGHERHVVCVCLPQSASENLIRSIKSKRKI